MWLCVRVRSVLLRGGPQFRKGAGPVRSGVGIARVGWLRMIYDVSIAWGSPGMAHLVLPGRTWSLMQRWRWLGSKHHHSAVL
jgi:hypothetical protein